MAVCDDVLEKLSMYIDEMLEPDEMADMAAHLSSCEDCRRQYEELLAILTAVKDLPDIDLPEGFHEETMEKIEKYKRKSPVIPFLTREFRQYVPVAAGVLGAFILMGSFVTAANYGLARSSGNTGLFDLAPKDAGFAVRSEGQDDIAMAGEVAVEESAAGPDIDTAIGAEGEWFYRSIEEAEVDGGFLEEIVNDTKEVAPYTQSSGVQELDGEVIQFQGDGKIRNYYITLETEDVAQLADQINAMAGYTEQSSISETYAQLTKRISADRQDTFVEALKAIPSSQVIDESASQKDISNNKIDNQSRLNARIAEQQRLIGLMDTAGEIKDLLTIENRIHDLEQEAGRYQANLRSYSNQEQSSSVTIRIIKQDTVVMAEKKGLGQRITDSFITSVNVTSRALEGILVAFSGMLPLAAVVLLVALPVIFLRKSINKR